MKFGWGLCYALIMERQSCSNCGKLKSLLICGLCNGVTCKNCAHFIEEDRVSFLTSIPRELSCAVNCSTCYTVSVLPFLEDYDQLVEKAKNILVFNKNQSKETRLIKRLEEPYIVHNCDSESDALLRMAFFAAQADFNSIIDVNIVSKKIKNGSYQTTKWSGTSIPAHVKDDKLIKDRSFSKRPN